nr:hypothetical protein [Tanacetum cinerariifolium]
MHIEKNVLESILNTLLMNDKSKDTTKVRQDLKRLGIRSGLWLGQNKKGKCSKPQAAYSFTPEDRKKFCQFIKGVKLLDGFICSQTLMVDDMLKAQSKVIDILCNLELIYPLAFFDIMIHLVIHLPLEAILGGPIGPRWMYPFERYIKKLKNYVRNKSKLEGSIAEGYAVEEALTFSSYYFRDVTTKINRPDRNVDCPPPTCQLQIRQRHVDNDPGVNESSELFALACRPSLTPISVNSCVVNGVSLNDLEIAVLHIDGQSIDVDAPPDIIDVVDEDDDIIDEEDPIPHDLADSDDEDL